jgi:hypothetical protein
MLKLTATVPSHQDPPAMLLLDLGDSSSFAWPLQTRDKQARAADRQDPLMVFRSTGKRAAGATFDLF